MHRFWPRSAVWAFGALLLLVEAIAEPARITPAQTAASVSAPPGVKLVYDIRGPNDEVEVWMADADGQGSRRVAALGSGTRALAVSGRQMVLGDSAGLVLLDLGSGALRKLPLPERPVWVLAAREELLFVAGRVGCGGPDARLTPLWRVTTATGDVATLEPVARPGFEPLLYDAARDELIGVPRACDPGLNELWTLNGQTGAILQRAAFQGCGAASVAPQRSIAVASWTLCGPHPSGDDVFAVVVDVDTGRTFDLKAIAGARVSSPLRFASDGSRAAFGLSMPSDDGGDMRVAAGLWVMDVSGLRTGLIWNARGSDMFAAGWSPDNRLLLAGVELEAGHCGYAIVDSTSGAVLPVAESIAVCGPAGTLWGWTTLD